MQANSQPQTSAPSLAFAELNGAAININEEASLTYWVLTLGCSELELRFAVAEVGSEARNVKTALGMAA